MMNLMTGLLGLGGHLGGWRHKDAWSDNVMNLDHAIETARTAERGLFDLLFLADGNAVRQMDKPALFAANSPSDRPAVFEPITLMTAVAQYTNYIGLLSTATTTYDEPYSLARRYASLDHLSKGRACWNIVTTSYPDDLLNFSRTEHVAKDERYERANEFVEICKGLWDSWAEDAFIQNKATGQFLDPTRVHTLNHKGKHFQVKGPLNVARMPQGYPVLFTAGQSEDGRELAAKHADCIFAVTNTHRLGQEILRRHQGPPRQVRPHTGSRCASSRAAPSMSAAPRAKPTSFYDELQSLIAPELGVPYLSKLCETDMSKFPLDGPMPDLGTQVLGIASFRNTIVEMAKRDKLTVRQTYERILPSMGHVTMKGSVKQVCDEIEAWYTEKACDGFNINTPVMPRSLNDFVDLVIPELQRRGLFRKAYEGKTLRERMGLPVPVNPHFGKTHSMAAE